MLSNNHSAHYSLAVNIGKAAPLSHSPQRQRPSTPFPFQSASHCHGSASKLSRASSCASLLFDLEIEDAADRSSPVLRLPTELQRLVSSNGRTQAMLWMHALQVREALSRDDAPNNSVDVQAFAQSLADLGHLVWLRNGTYTCPAEFGLASIKHTFVIVSLPGDHSNQPFYCVVDPNWQEHFQLSGDGSEDYRQLLSLLPRVFVGCADKLATLVTLLCKEMEKVFQSRGVPLPLWRSPRVMQGRWLVNQAEDQYIPPSHMLPMAPPPQMGAALQPVV